VRCMWGFCAWEGARYLRRSALCSDIRADVWEILHGSFRVLRGSIGSERNSGTLDDSSICWK
jgi:hypothetical protein